MNYDVISHLSPLGPLGRRLFIFYFFDIRDFKTGQREWGGGGLFGDYISANKVGKKAFSFIKCTVCPFNRSDVGSTAATLLTWYCCHVDC